VVDYLEALLGVSVWGAVKGAFLFALFLYFVFALVVVKQVKMMTQVVSGVLDAPIKVVAWIHLLFSFLVILFALIIL